MTPWTHLDTAWSEDGARLDLYGRNGRHMIRAGGWELMNNEHHASEDQLGRLAAQLPGVPRPRILVGGLGLGCTLRGLLAALAGQDGEERGAEVVVAERSAAVLGWFRTRVDQRLAAALPAGVRLLRADVAAQLGAGRDWDRIVLDIDNGPEALSAPANAALYGEDGLALCRDSLAPAGHLLLWSGFADAGFVARAAAAGFRVTQQPVPLPNRPDAAHLLYVLSRTPITAAQRDRLGLRQAA